MRVTTDLWVAALVRRVFSAGGFAAIVKRGAAEAGTVHVLVRGRMGEMALYAPAPSTSYDTAKPDERYFIALEGLSDAEIEKRLDRERRFDPDVWVIELEIADGKIGELIALAETG